MKIRTYCALTVTLASTLLATACLYQQPVSSIRSTGNANVDARRTLEEDQRRYCDGDHVKPGVKARLLSGDPLTDQYCQSIREGVDEYRKSPNGVPLPRIGSVVSEQALKKEYSRRCNGDHIRPEVAAQYARSRMAAYAPTDESCAEMRGVLSGNLLLSTEAHVADLKKRAGLQDSDMPVENALIELLKNNTSGARPFILMMEREALGGFGVPTEMQLPGTSNLLGNEFPTTSVNATALAVLFDLSIAKSDPEIRANALQLILSTKAADLNRATARIQAIDAFARRGDGYALVRRLQAAYASAAAVWVRAARQQTTPSRSELDPKIYQIRDLEQAIEARLPSSRTETLGPRVADVKAMLGPNDALVEYSIVWLPKYQPNGKPVLGKFADQDIHYVAYVLKAAGQSSVFDLGRAAVIDASLREYRCAIQHPAPTVSDRLKAASQPVYSSVWLPLQEVLDSVRKAKGHVYIAPDGKLSLLPFEALLDEHGKFVFANWRISYLVSGGDLTRMSSASSIDIGAGRDMAAFVSPQNLGTVGAESVQNACGGGESGLSSGYDGLSGTEQEGVNIRSHFAEARVFDAVNAEAGASSEHNLKSLRSPRVLHLATHGYYVEPPELPIVPPMLAMGRRAPFSLLRSGFLLEEYGSQRGGEDGIVTGLEIAMLDLHSTDLVVVSACDSGVVDGMPAGSVGGLRAAFQIAGAKAIVSSLWEVVDATGPELMGKFYAGLKQHQTVDAALRSAKKAVMDEHPHPFYWAAFVLNGNKNICLRGRCVDPLAGVGAQ